MLERCGQVGLVGLDESGVGGEGVAECVEKRCLQSAETVVESGDVWSGEPETQGVALRREPVDVGASWIGESHHLGALVECLSGGVVDGLSEYLHVGV